VQNVVSRHSGFETKHLASKTYLVLWSRQIWHSSLFSPRTPENYLWRNAFGKKRVGKIFQSSITQPQIVGCLKLGSWGRDQTAKIHCQWNPRWRTAHKFSTFKSLSMTSMTQRRADSEEHRFAVEKYQLKA